MTKTKSEALFERFLETNNIHFRAVPVGPSKTPDYELTIAGAELFFEVKELAEESAFRSEAVHTNKVGEQIRDRISRARKQIQPASKQGKPAVLLIFNNLDPLQFYGTENHDFEHAMYGEHTVAIAIASGKIVDSFHGENKSFQPSKNTSFSALGRLEERRDSIGVTLFENIHARVAIDYSALPACFKVIKFERRVP